MLDDRERRGRFTGRATPPLAFPWGWPFWLWRFEDDDVVAVLRGMRSRIVNH